MSNPAAFLRAIIEAPEDDGPRLRFADFLEETGAAADAARAEFIRVQIALERLPEGDPERPALRERERFLFGEHWPDWLRPVCEAVGDLPVEPSRWLDRVAFFLLTPPAPPFRPGRFAGEIILAAGGRARRAVLRRVRFRRGLIEYAALSGSPAAAGERAARLFDLAPVRDVKLTEFDGDSLRVLAEAGVPARLRSLRITANGSEGLREFLGRLSPSGLVELEIAGDGRRGEGPAPTADWLAPALRLGGLKSLTLTRLGLAGNDAARIALAPALAGLEALDLSENAIGPAGAEALAESPHLGGLTSLSLFLNPIGAEGRRLLFERFRRRLFVSRVDP